MPCWNTGPLNGCRKCVNQGCVPAVFTENYVLFYFHKPPIPLIIIKRACLG